jgi:uncharacterized membrane protein required for colicin V production
MIDFLLGLFLAGLLARGWLRGMVREVLDLVGLIAGLFIAFRLSAPFGDFLTESFGVTPEVARVGAGVALFILFGVAMGVAAHYLTRMMSIPGLTLVNRLGGAVVAMGWGIAVVVVLVNVARAMPLPEDWEQGLEDSTVVSAIAGPDSVPQEILETLAGDNVMAALAAIQEVFGDSRAVPEGDEVLHIPPAAPDEIRQVRGEADRVTSEINEFRAGLEVRALQPSAALTAVAESKAIEAYTTGVLARSDCATPIMATGLRVLQCGQTLALASTALAAFDGMLDSPTGYSELSQPGYDRIGVSVVEGPLGRLVVVVLAR